MPVASSPRTRRNHRLNRQSPALRRPPVRRRPAIRRWPPPSTPPVWIWPPSSTPLLTRLRRPARRGRARRVVTTSTTGRSTTMAPPLRHADLPRTASRRAVTDALADTVAPGIRWPSSVTSPASIRGRRLNPDPTTRGLRAAADQHAAAALTRSSPKPTPRAGRRWSTWRTPNHYLGPEPVEAGGVRHPRRRRRPPDALAAARLQLHDSGVVVQETQPRSSGAAAPPQQAEGANARRQRGTRWRCWSPPRAPPAPQRARCTLQSRAANMALQQLVAVGRPRATAPSIVLCFLPMSHVMGRGILYDALSMRRLSPISPPARPVHPDRGPVAGASHPTQLRAADLGHAAPGNGR